MSEKTGKQYCNYYDTEAGSCLLDQDARLILCPFWRTPDEAVCVGNPQDLPFTPGRPC